MIKILQSARWMASIILLIASAIPGNAQEVLNARTQPQFVNALPVPPVIDARNSAGPFTIDISQFTQQLGIMNGTTTLTTTVWGYNGHYPGPTILARKDQPLQVFWRNKLLNSTGQPLPHLLPLDASIHWAYMNSSDVTTYGVPIVTHLHGGKNEVASDGLPLAWYAPDFALKGAGFTKGDIEPYTYSNSQEAATLWYHDHAMGITRLNVYAGLAGFYLLTDANEQQLQESNILPASAYDLGLAIQDRMFTVDGKLFYPSTSEEEGAPNPSVLPEFFGNIILVNGMAWPYLNVEPRAYRFRILNGSDSRFYNLFLSNGQTINQIGSDQGLLPAPVPFTQVLIAPGERKEVIIDFTGMEGQTIIMKNNAKAPYPKGTIPDPQTLGRIMAFNVSLPFNTEHPATNLTSGLRPPIERLTTTLESKKLILFEGEDEYDRLKPMLGTLAEGVKEWNDPITENVQLGSTEIWEIYNETMDAHPIHLHSVSMQLVNRQKFHAAPDGEEGKLKNIRFIGQPQLPAAEEQGWKDTWIMNPGEATRVIAKFDLPGTYIWHCHILSHEDHEMMRPFYVGTIAAAVKVQPPLLPEVKALNVWPNPLSHVLNVEFSTEDAGVTVLKVYDSKGAVIRSSAYVLNKGSQHIKVDGSAWTNGVYYIEVITGTNRQHQKVVVQH